MLRILHVVTYMGRGGLETMLMNYYRNIDRTKVQFDFLEHRMFEAEYDQEIRKLGGRIFRVQRLNPFSPSYCAQINKFLSDHPEYKIIHVHQDCMSSIVLKSAFQHGIPIRIAHSHNSLQNKDLKYPLKLYFKNRIGKYATHLFACSESSGDWMFGTQQFSIIKNAIDTSNYQFDKTKRMQIRHSLGIDKNVYAICCIAAFRKQKNHSFSLKVFQKIISEIPNSILYLAGEGPLKDTIKRQAKELGIDAYVKFIGNLEDVGSFLQGMDLFLMPSFFEGLSLSLIEAQTSGIHCLISNRISNEGIIVPEIVHQMDLNDSHENWALKAINLYNQPGRQNQKQRIVDAGFEIKKESKKLELFYLNMEKQI